MRGGRLFLAAFPPAAVRPAEKAAPGLPRRRNVNTAADAEIKKSKKRGYRKKEKGREARAPLPCVLRLYSQKCN